MRKVILMVRSDLDWSTCSIDEFERSAKEKRLSDSGGGECAWLAGRRAFDALGGMSYFEYRAGLTDIARRNWIRAGADAVFMRFDPESVFGFPDDALVVPVDDDDWISPGLCEMLRESDSFSNRWSIYRLFAAAGSRVHERESTWIHFPTCGYAVSVCKLKQLSALDRHRLLFWHQGAAQMLHANLIPIIGGMSVKFPTSAVTARANDRLDEIFAGFGGVVATAAREVPEFRRELLAVERLHRRAELVFENSAKAIGTSLGGGGQAGVAGAVDL